MKFDQLTKGYANFRKKYAGGDQSTMQHLADHGQKPQIMVVACCDSRVDPAIILQCDPGDLFVVRNIANIVPPYESDHKHHGTSAALEYGICYLNVAHLIILGHSQCGGIGALLSKEPLVQDDFISSWVSLAQPEEKTCDVNQMVKQTLNHSYQNCLSFPWMKTRMQQKKLTVHRWFFDIQSGEVFTYSTIDKTYKKHPD